MTIPSLVQETPIEKILQEHLWIEIIALEDIMTAMTKHHTALAERRDRLKKHADIEGLDDPRLMVEL